MRRRKFLGLVGAAAAWPFDAHGQQFKKPVRIAFLPVGSPGNAYDQSLVEAFRRGLQQVDLVEDRDVMFDVMNHRRP